MICTYILYTPFILPLSLNTCGSHSISRLHALQALSLGCFRNDIMIDGGDNMAWKQVEFNTIASGFGHLGPVSRVIQRFLPCICICLLAPLIILIPSLLVLLSHPFGFCLFLFLTKREPFSVEFSNKIICFIIISSIVSIMRVTNRVQVLLQQEIPKKTNNNNKWIWRIKGGFHR